MSISIESGGERYSTDNPIREVEPSRGADPQEEHEF
jgi:hypothetical protein